MKFSALMLIGCLAAGWNLRAEPAAAPAALAKAESLWAHRGDPAQARLCLAAYAEAAAAQPENAAVWARLARIRYLVANYVEKDGKARDALLQDGMDAALHALNLAPSYRDEFARTKSEKKAALKTGKEGIDALYWYAANLGRWASDKSILTRLARKSTLEAFNRRVLELDETYFYAAPHRFFGALPTKVPGGDLDDSRKHFEKAIALAPNYFGTRTLFAELYAVKAKDKAVFQTQLEYVVKTSADIVPDIAPENHYEQENAKALLARIGDLFP